VACGVLSKAVKGKIELGRLLAVECLCYTLCVTKTLTKFHHKLKSLTFSALLVDLPNRIHIKILDLHTPFNQLCKQLNFIVKCQQRNEDLNAMRPDALD